MPQAGEQGQHLGRRVAEAVGADGDHRERRAEVAEELARRCRRDCRDAEARPRRTGAGRGRRAPRLRRRPARAGDCPPISTSTTSAASFSPWLPASPGGGRVGSTRRRQPSPAEVQGRHTGGHLDARRGEVGGERRAAPATAPGARAAGRRRRRGGRPRRRARRRGRRDRATRRRDRRARTPRRLRRMPSGSGPASIRIVGPSGTCRSAAAPSPTARKRSVGAEGAAGATGASRSGRPDERRGDEHDPRACATPRST